MKCAFCLLFIILLCLRAEQSVAVEGEVQTPNPSDLFHMAHLSTADCYEDEEQKLKVEFTIEGLLGLLQGSRDPPRNTKCIRYCIMRKNKLFNDKNLLDADEMLGFFGSLYNNEIAENILKEVIQECNEKAENEADRCERAFQATMCIIAGLGEKAGKEI